MLSNRKVLGVIVTFNPNTSSLNSLVRALSAQVSELLIIDNCSKIKPKLSKEEAHWIYNQENLGVAAAYNQGWLFAKDHGMSHIVLFDQDSLPADDMVNHLLTTLVELNQNQLVAAAAGPNYCDIKGQQRSPFVKKSGCKLRRVPCGVDEVVQVDHLISSGTLIDLSALEKVGAFSQELFIDYVDTEWCLRARRLGLQLLGVGRANMTHNIGDATFRVFRHQLPLHNPIRLYYQFRNQVWLLFQPWVGWQWRTIDLLRMSKLLIAFCFFAPNKKANFWYIIKGIFDGLKSKMGRIDSP